jgi:hypothetical protein
MLVEVGRGRVIAQLLLAQPVLLFVGLAAISLITNASRLGTHLAGGALLPAQGLAATWSDYLASWHSVAGGTAAPAPATLAVLGALGTVLGGPPTALAVLLLGDAPLAGVLAYAATRRLPVRRWVRALAAAGYALLPPATTAVAHGRLDVVVVHILLPPVLVGVMSVLNPSARGWLSAAAGSALGLAVIGAFSPLVHGLVLLIALVGFVVVPGGLGDGRRRVAALFAIVLLPLALLVPWPAVVLTHPSVLLSGTTDLPTSPAAVLVGNGILWALLGACRADNRLPAPSKIFAGLAALALLALTVGDVLIGHAGPVRDNAPTLAPALASELSTTGRSTLVLATNGQPIRQTGGRLPGFADDDIPRVPGATQRLDRWNTDLTSGDPARTRAAIAQAATAGVLFVVLPDHPAADRFTRAAGDLASTVSPTSNGSPVERLQPASGAATLISPALARQAVTGGQPPTTLGAEGIAPVDAAPPEVAVRVSEGAPGRLLVLAAEDEDGWQATVDGRPAPTVKAWGHLVAVSLPTAASDVEVQVPTALRDALLLVQAAVLLFVALTAIPSRRKR